MKTSSLTLVLLILMAVAIPAFAQYPQSAGYTCWACPVCGSVFTVTAEEAASANPYDVCPVCYSAYLGTFVQVPCQAVTGYNQQIENPPLNNISRSNLGPENIVTQMGKILMVLAPKDYQEEELNVPRDYFRSKGYSVFLASKGVKTATGMNGENASVDQDLKDVRLSDYAAIVFVGGEGIYYLKLNEDPAYLALAKAAGAQKKLIGAICLGPWILADAGLLNGKKATASETDHLKSKGAVVVDQAVVRDGNIITGNGPGASQEFAEAVVAALEESGSGSSSSGNQGITQNPALRASPVASSPKYKCTKCAYVYDPAVGDPTQGIPAGTPFDKLPSTWKCPWCGASKSQFVKA